MNEKSIARAERAIEAIRNGEIVILVDDEDRENEGDLVIAAECVTPEAINFMATHGRGLICLAMTGEQLDKLQIPMMVRDNTSPFSTAFTVSIEAAEGVTTGISAADRSRTVQVAIAPDSGPADIVMPGHIFPLRARDGGVLVRTGQTEGSVDLARLAGLAPAGVICEVMNADGTMARMPELEVFAKEHDMVIASVADLINYRLQRESLVEIASERPLPTEHPGDWRVRVVKSVLDGSTHICLICGKPQADSPTLVRVQHRADIFDVFLEKESEAYETVRGSMEVIAEEGCGVIVYLDKTPMSAHEWVDEHIGDGEQGERDVNKPQEALRDLGLGAQILVGAGVGKMRVLTNRQKNFIGLDGYGLEVVEQLPIPLRGAKVHER
jgi:3,4-dihydroxy 2-butanone 4-phosphate synthase/GTP cyclohydrolase II